MKKFFLHHLLCLVCLLSTQLQAQTVVINTGVAGTPAYNAGPLYRSSAGSAYDASRYTYLYTAAELATAGIPSGATISQLGWVKNNTATSTGGGIVRIYMKNSTATAFSNATETWANLNASTSMVYENLSFTVPATAAPNYITFVLTNSFTYTGGALEISVEWDINQVTGSPSSGTFDWLWSTVTDRIYGTGQTVLANAGTLSSTSNSISDINDRRPFIQITYAPGGPCSNPPLAGTATANNSAPVCAATPVQLNLTGGSSGTGLTFEWERSISNTPFTPTSISTAAASPAFIINPTTTAWYRVKSVCSGGTPVYSAPVQVVVTSGLAGGTYTINSAVTTGSGNFQTFADAIAAMNCGVSGPVTFNVAAGSGPYNETVSFGNIAGTSATNKVRVNGNGATVQFANTTTDRQMLKLEGTSYLTINNLNFVATATGFGWGAIINNGARYDSIINCTFDLSAVTTTTAANTVGIGFSGSLTSATTAGDAKYCYINNNNIIGALAAGGPYYGIILNGGADSNIVSNNTLANYYMYGIYLSGATANRVEGNLMHRSGKTAVTTHYGIYATGNIAGSVINANRIHSPGGVVVASTSSAYGIYLTSATALPASPALISNNIYYRVNQGGIIYGIYLSGATNMLVYHNTVLLDQILTGTSVNAGIYCTGTNTGSQLKNNIVSIREGTQGIKYGIYYNLAASIGDAQRNNVYVNSAQTGAQYYAALPAATTYNDLAAFQLANPTLEIGSIAVNPNFTNIAQGNLLPMNSVLGSNGENLLSLVPKDIAGTSRSGLPTPGAFEMPPVIGNDAGVVSLITPTGLYCSNQQAVRVSIINGGSTQVSNFQVHWALNGVPQAPFSYTGTLDTFGGIGHHLDTVLLGTVTFPAGPNTVKAWTVVSNEVNTGNDTLVAITTPAVFSITGSPDTVCIGGNAILNLSPGTGYSTGILQWQSSPDGTSFTAIANTDVTTYNANALTATRYYRVFINSGTGGCYSNVKQVTVNNPLITGSVPGSRCGTGTVLLSATANNNNIVAWYSAPTGGTALNTGNSFTTPTISANTTYYAAAKANGTTGGQVGPATPGALGAGGYTNLFTYKTYFTVNSSLVLASVDIFANTTGSTGAIEILQEPSLAVVSTTPFTTTTSGSLTTGQTIPLNTALAPGTYSIKFTSGTTGSYYRNTAGASFPYSIPELTVTGQNFSGFPAYYYYTYNFNVASTACEGPRVPVLATVNPSPAVNLGNDTTVCGTGSIVLNAGNAGAAYVWDNSTTAQTRTVSATGTYYVAVSQAGCTGRDTIQVTYSTNPVVNLGNDTAICPGTNLVLNAGNAGLAYLWDNATTAQTRTVNAAGSYYVAVTNGANCKGRDTIQVTLSTQPTVNLGADTAICDGNSVVLNAGNTGSSFLWDDNSTTQTRNVNLGGTYFVKVTNAALCSASDTLTLTVNSNPTVNLGDDTVICEGVQLALNAGNAGATYIWDDASTGQTRSVTDSGSYWVSVTDGNNCRGSDTVLVDVTPLPGATITAVHNGDGAYTFTATNVTGTVSNYIWSFGDQSPNGTGISVNHAYAANGTYTVTLTLQGECQATVTLSLVVTGKIVGIDQVAPELVQLSVYPNPANNELTIENKSGLAIESIEVRNIIGQQVYSASQVNGSKHHLDLSGYASGVYTALIKTAKGSVVRKFEVLR